VIVNMIIYGKKKLLIFIVRDEKDFNKPQRKSNRKTT
jgi:ribosomal protein L25 (general stress protein Ctc)